ncbi:AraC family transcriptional regulator N-terminal domain-containing protein [Dyella tabacisoli]|uniref:AraC family transcriptional regulator n=2 Tax=Dyella tabacisoli TaxID=2282381 RepID=A0A369UIR7_9GAMM|nr:AraC family transcriptional regulator [Dyella tabacisoli]RDD80005.1 AraC family transcriptional regulator [Dyella tabacisoli]
MDTHHSDLPMAAMSAELGGIIARFAPSDGDHAVAVPWLTLHRYSQIGDLSCGMSRPSLIIAAQGAKRIIAAGEGYDYDARHFLITSIDLPVMSRITQASVAQPYLCMAMSLDLQLVAALMADMGRPRSESFPIGRPIAVGSLSQRLLDTALRLARLLDHPDEIHVLAPLLEREILFLLLSGEHGRRLGQLAAGETGSSKIARAIDWLKNHYDKPLSIDALSQRLNMSVSSLHHHFKDVTSMSPLQYQKQLRLHEARRMLLGSDGDVGTVALRVGYDSASQFSREYSRLFGAPPLRDILRIRAAVSVR